MNKYYELAASLLDLAWHQLQPEEVPDAEGLLDFEAKALDHLSHPGRKRRLQALLGM